MLQPAKNLMALCAADIMSHHVVMIPREMSLQGAARMLARSGVTGAPVVDANSRCVGVLSATDFMHAIEHEQHDCRNKPHAETMCKPWQMLEKSVEPSCTVEDFMTKDPVQVVACTKIGVLVHDDGCPHPSLDCDR